jgi:hypothetical protein
LEPLITDKISFNYNYAKLYGKDIGSYPQKLILIDEKFYIDLLNRQDKLLNQDSFKLR